MKNLLLLFTLLSTCAVSYSQTNLALGKTVTSSSNFNASSYPNSNLVDGNFSTFAATAGTATPPLAEWFFVDLGADYFIDSIVLGSRPGFTRELRFMIVTWPSSLTSLGADPSSYIASAASAYNRLVYTDGSVTPGGSVTSLGTSSANPDIPGIAGQSLGPAFPGNKMGLYIGVNKARYLLLLNLQDEIFNPTELQVFSTRTSTRSIVNGGFEQGSTLTSANYENVREGDVPGWSSTEAVSMDATHTDAPVNGSFIEFWRTGFIGVPSRQGNFFAELNAFVSGQLEQRQICVLAGETFNFSFAHRGRSGVDVMRLRINDADVAEISDNNASGGTHTAALLVSASVASISGPSGISNGWGTYSGTWTNNTGSNQLVSFGFRAISTASGNIATGNFLDAVSFSGLDATTSFNQASATGPETTPSNNLQKLLVTGSLVSAATVQLNITGGTATRGVDYTTTPASGLITITIPAGDYDGTDATAISLSPYIHINTDAVNGEANETILMTLQTPGTGLKINDANACTAAISNINYTITDVSTLPVILTSFTAQKQDNKGLLKWHTATEVNTGYYAIEKSTGSSGFMEIGRVTPTGNESNYSFTDKFLSDGNNYYRLKIVDADGKFDYSDLRLIRNGHENQMQLLPNPVHSFAKLTLTTTGSQAATVQLYNQQGALIKTVSAANKQVVEIDFSGLPTGVYFVKYTDGQEQFNSRVVKQ